MRSGAPESSLFQRQHMGGGGEPQEKKFLKLKHSEEKASLQTEPHRSPAWSFVGGKRQGINI